MRLLPSRLMRHLRPMVPAPDVLARMRALPIVDPDALLGPGGLLVLAPHPDDESLGCGGLIALCAARGRDVRVMLVTDGTGSHPHSKEYPAPRLAALRRRELGDAVTTLGLAEDRITCLGVKDTATPLFGPRLRAVGARVSAFIHTHGIGTICTSWQHDPHRDHVAAYRIGRLAARATGARLLCYAVWGWTLTDSAWLPAGPIRGGRIDIAAHRATRRRAVLCHRSQTSGLIADDPSGFRLSAEQLATFDQPYETFVEG